MIDYVTLMLINMSAGFVILALFITIPILEESHQGWSPAFAAPGLVAIITGFVMSFTWPLPSPYNIAFGELSVLLGMLFLAASVCIAKKWDLLPITIFAIFAGITAVVVGIRFIDLGLSKTPVLSGIGFILPGIGGICSPLAVKFKKITSLRISGAILLFASAAIWLYVGYYAYWSHLKVN